MSESILNELGLHHLRALDTILREGSVTRAADTLGLSQSALSHQLARLRDVLGDPLVVRGGTGVVGTPRALALKGPLRDALAELERAIRQDDRWDPDTAQRRFAIAMPDHFALLILTDLLPRIEKAAPGVDVLVHSADGVNLDVGPVELVLGGLQFAPAGLKTRALVSTSFACAVRRDHPTVGKGMDLDTYCGLDHLLISPRGRPGGIVDDALADLGRDRRIRAATASFVAAPLILQSTDMVLTAPRRLLQFMAQREPLRLMEPPAGLTLPTFRLALWWHPRHHADEGHRWFRSLIANAFGAPT